MNIQEALTFQRQQELPAWLAIQVKELTEAMAEITGRLDKIEAAACAITSRRASTHPGSAAAGHVIGAPVL